MLAIAALLLSIAAAPQNVPAARVDETISVELVNVEVFVTDRKGNRVRGLTSADFVIKEDGRVQPITNFTEYTSAIQDVKVTSGIDAPAASPEPARTPPQQKRTIVVFIEHFKLPNFRVEPMFASIRSMLREAVRPGDEVAVYTWRDGLSQRLPFTDDLSEIDATLAEVEKESIGVQGNPIEAMDRERAFQEAFYENLGARAGTSDKGDFVKRSKDDAEKGNFREQAGAFAELAYIRRKAADMRMLLRTIADSPGRKIMLMATHRFGAYAGAQFFPNGQVPPRMWAALDTRREREAVARAANTYGVTLYPVYPAGLSWTPLVSPLEGPRANINVMSSDLDSARSGRDHAILMNETSSLNEIARGTGGLFAWGHRDIMQLMPRIEDDLETYYSLAYRPTPGAKRGRIAIETKDRRYTVRSRREFLVRDDTTKMEDRVVGNLTRAVDGTTIPFEVEFGDYQRQSRYAWTVPLSIRIPVSALTALPGDEGRVGEFTVYVAVGAETGVLSEVQHRNQRFRIIDEEAARGEGAYFTYEFTLQVRPRAGRVSIGVMDEVSKEFGAQVVDLPNFPQVR